MAKVTIVQDHDGTISIAPIVRDQAPGETDAEFYDACTRRVLAGSDIHITVECEERYGIKTDAATALTLLQRDFPHYVKPYVVGIFDHSEYEKLAQHKEFRQTWRANKDGVSFDIAQVKQIHLDRIREKRNAKLQELDKDVVINIRNPKKLEEIDIEKQRLRDLPQTIAPELNKATTVEEIKAIQPL